MKRGRRVPRGALATATLAREQSPPGIRTAVHPRRAASPNRPNRHVRLTICHVLFTLATLHAAGCTAPRIAATPEPVPVEAEGEGAAIDPIGIYDLTMSSETMVSEGTMEIYGEPGGYLGRVSVGSVNGRILLVEPGEGGLTVQVDVEGGRLVFRLAGDPSYLSGNWVMGGRRGTVVAERRAPAAR